MFVFSAAAMGTQGTVLVTSAMNAIENQGHGNNMLAQNKYEVSNS